MESSPSTPPVPSLRWSGCSDRGRIRANNEDAFLGLHFDAHEVKLLGKFGEASLQTGDFAFAVSDGMGGAHAGELASRITVDKITTLLPKTFQQSAVGLEAGYLDVLGELYEQIHRALLYVGGSYEECAGMGATLSLGWFTPTWLYFAHIGDSRIYYLPASGGFRQLTEDDTYVGWLYRNGKINEREARTHPRRNILQKALGAGHQFVDPQVGAVGLQSGDRFLLCTDGVVDGLFDARLAELGREPLYHHGKWLAEALVRTAVEQSGRDNTTALLVEVI